MPTSLTPVRAWWDLPVAYRDTPIGELFAYHNFGKPPVKHAKADLLIGICMDHRASLRIPEGFAYILRSGGANLRPLEFNVSYAVGVKHVSWVALIAHSGCGAAGLRTKREEFVEGLIENAGWRRKRAEEHFDTCLPLYEIDDAASFVLREAEVIRREYEGVKAVPLFLDLADGMLSIVASDATMKS